eukprot:TRINITY_DN5891_c0_g2_i1.p1 TRINITY_DN5891_c0_g2~~TRINITY_DN5891_c0_g2_i1.p1  ORF type:complete len:1826 (+),score=364.90 TRINITY_DN5891_c0_g2_i1:281-5479(+)
MSRLDPVSLRALELSCRHLRFLAVPIIPALKLTLYPHQRAAVRWMMEREAQPARIPHPFIRCLQTEDGFEYFASQVDGELLTTEIAGERTKTAIVGRKLNGTVDGSASLRSLRSKQAEGGEASVSEEVGDAMTTMMRSGGQTEGLGSVNSRSSNSSSCLSSSSSIGSSSSSSLSVTRDFRGGFFCDEPGLGKTITALALILKTQGCLAAPPGGPNVNSKIIRHPLRPGVCQGYYEIGGKMSQVVAPDAVTPPTSASISKAKQGPGSSASLNAKGLTSSGNAYVVPPDAVFNSSGSSSSGASFSVNAASPPLSRFQLSLPSPQSTSPSLGRSSSLRSSLTMSCCAFDASETVPPSRFRVLTHEMQGPTEENASDAALPSASEHSSHKRKTSNEALRRSSAPPPASSLPLSLSEQVLGRGGRPRQAKLRSMHNLFLLREGHQEEDDESEEEEVVADEQLDRRSTRRRTEESSPIVTAKFPQKKRKARDRPGAAFGSAQELEDSQEIEHNDLSASLAEKPSSASEDDSDDPPILPEGEANLWVECDSCKKWRRLTADSDTSAGAWFCQMNPDTSKRSCDDPEEDTSDECTEHMQGFCKGEDLRVEGRDCKENVLFFQDCMVRYMASCKAALRDVEMLVTWVLVNQSAALRLGGGGELTTGGGDQVGSTRGGRIGGEQMVSPAVGLRKQQSGQKRQRLQSQEKLLEQQASAPSSELWPPRHLQPHSLLLDLFGFQKQSLGAVSLKERYVAHGTNRRRRKAVVDRRWRYPPHLNPSLVLDTVALRQALRCVKEQELRQKREGHLHAKTRIGGAFGLVRASRDSETGASPSKRRKTSELFYLSSATLIVVPPNLIPHWLSQIEQHTLPDHLRVFVWEGSEQQQKSVLPQTLAWDYDVVITTFTRLSVEWNSGGRQGGAVSPLLQIHWLRLLLDEGHTLGGSLALTNKLQMAVALRAERRWLLTGTPTPNTPSSQVAHIQPLLKFLHETTFGAQQRLWEMAIQRPFEALKEEGRQRLQQLLHRCMVCALKDTIRTLPKCFRKVTLLDFSAGHASSYNELVETVKRNVLMADWGDPDHAESLLNPKQWKLARELLNNVRISCCVAGHMSLQDVGSDIEDTMLQLEVEANLCPLSDRYKVIQRALKLGSMCDRCGQWCRLPAVTPCCHVLCLACVEGDRERCVVPGCARGYKMQENKPRADNPNPKWAVPQDLIELQPSYAQDRWSADWENTASSKVDYLIQKLLLLNTENANERIRQLEPNALEELAVSERGPADVFGFKPVASAVPTRGRAVEPHKVIIFSQFLEHIHLVQAQLVRASIRCAGMYSPRPREEKLRALEEFEKDPECLALLMDSQGSLGLDLSFATHVFLMEPIWDRSVEEQVIARAWRMGARRDVQVETLAMRGTIEEQMLKHLQDPTERGSLRSQREMQEVTVRTRILHGLTFVRHLPSSRTLLAEPASATPGGVAPGRGRGERGGGFGAESGGEGCGEGRRAGWWGDERRLGGGGGGGEGGEGGEGKSTGPSRSQEQMQANPYSQVPPAVLVPSNKQESTLPSSSSSVAHGTSVPFVDRPPSSSHFERQPWQSQRAGSPPSLIGTKQDLEREASGMRSHARDPPADSVVPPHQTEAEAATATAAAATVGCTAVGVSEVVQASISCMKGSRPCLPAPPFTAEEPQPLPEQQHSLCGTSSKWGERALDEGNGHAKEPGDVARVLEDEDACEGFVRPTKRKRRVRFWDEE